MEDIPRTAAERHIEELLRNLDPNSDRYRVLKVARQFKASWVDLGERLTAVKHKGAFREWGYDSFEAYCSKEIHIRRPTAEKLTLAYHFMTQEEPELQARYTEMRPVPDFRAVDLLRQAHADENFSTENYQELRRAVIDEERSLPTVRKRFQDLTLPQQNPAEEQSRLRGSALSTARRLAGLLEQIDDCPQGHADQVKNLVQFLEETSGQSI